MSAYSRVSPDGWEQGDDSSASSRVTPTGWEQVAATGGGTSAPTLSAPTVTSVTTTGATARITATGGRGGTIYWTVQLAGTDPSTAEVAAGQDGVGAALAAGQKGTQA